MHAPRHRICTTLLATKLHNFGPQKSLKTYSTPLFLVPPLSRERLIPFMADLPAQRFDDPETNPYPLKNVGLDNIGPIYIAEKDTTEKKLPLSLYLFNNACNPPGNYRQSDN